ncbi:MAG: hypothetical protein ACF8LL_09010, partial [Phycisphaerales bacterium]
MNPDDQQPQDPSLEVEDQQLVDRILEHGLDHTDPESETESRLQELLALLGTPVQGESHRDSRADMIEIRARRIQREGIDEAQLSREDQA